MRESESEEERERETVKESEKEREREKERSILSHWERSQLMCRLLVSIC